MDIKIQTKIAVLLEKINYLNLSIQQHDGHVSNIDKDLLTNYVRELYELALSLPVNAQQPFYGQQPPMYQQPDPRLQQQPYPPQQPYQAQSPNGFSPPNASPIGNQPPNPLPPSQSQNQNTFRSLPQVNGNHTQYPDVPEQHSTPSAVPPSLSSPLNPAVSFANGKRTLSDSIRIKTAETEKPSVNEQFKREESHLATKMQLTPIKDLKTFIGLNKRFSYINFLFGNDANVYDDAIEKLNTIGNKQGAMDFLNNHLRPKLKWSEDNEMVGEFYTLIERRYM